MFPGKTEWSAGDGKPWRRHRVGTLFVAHITFSPVASCDVDTVASTAAPSPQLVLSTAALDSGPKSQPGRGVPTKEGGNGIKLNPDEKWRSG